MALLPASLEQALALVADELAALPAEQWGALCQEEAAELAIAHQFFDAFGFPNSFPPERLIGHRIIELLTERHPLVFGQEVVGSA